MSRFAPVSPTVYRCRYSAVLLKLFCFVTLFFNNSSGVLKIFERGETYDHNQKWLVEKFIQVVEKKDLYFNSVTDFCLLSQKGSVL